MMIYEIEAENMMYALVLSCKSYKKWSGFKFIVLTQKLAIIDKINK